MTTSTSSDTFKGPHKTGKRICLIRVEYSKEAYKDQFGLHHSGWVVQEVVVVEIVEEKAVKGNYRPENSYVGYRAVAGDREFLCNFDSFDDSSSAPYECWMETTYKNAANIMFSDVTKNRYFPLVDQNGEPPKSFPLSKICNKHRYMTEIYREDGECFRCKFGLP